MCPPRLLIEARFLCAVFLMLTLWTIVPFVSIDGIKIIDNNLFQEVRSCQLKIK